MRTVILGVLGVIGLLVLGVVAFVGFKLMGNVKMPENLATRPWVEHKFYTERLAIDVPWALKTVAVPKNVAPTDCRTDGHRQDELEVVTGVSQPSAFGGAIDLAVDGMARILKAKTDGSTILKEAREEQQILGTRAVTLKLLGQNRWRKKYDVRILFFKVDGRCYQVHCTTPAGDPTGDKIWDRMLKSIRISRAAGSPSKMVEPVQGLGLPQGMERR